VRRLAALALALWIAGGTIASADTLTPTAYQQRLTQARALVTNRSLPAARTLLARTDALSLPDGTTYAMRDTELLDAIDRNVDPARLVEMIDAQLLASRSVRPVDPSVARDRLRDIVDDYTAAESSASFIDLIVQFVARLLSGLGMPSIDPWRLLPAVGLLGAALIVLILAVLGRGVRERITADATLSSAPSESANDPRAHLAAADAAMAARRQRDAIHALYLYALTTLAQREVIRYDPSLTDGELILRTAALPQAKELRDLIALYERSWFGLREPGDEDMRRARDLALRVAA
jgi:hypothetical protein